VHNVTAYRAFFAAGFFNGAFFTGVFFDTGFAFAVVLTGALASMVISKPLPGEVALLFL
jgi:hypothetical protein